MTLRIKNSQSTVPARALSMTLKKITEFIAGELACPTAVAPEWSEFEWTIARAVAAMHGVSPLLSRTLRWQGPRDWAQFLNEQRTHTAARHVRISELLQLIHLRLRDADIAAVALKGAALYAMGLYLAGDRPMADIDVLVAPTDAEQTAGLLRSTGFRESSANWKERVFVPTRDHAPAPLGEHSNNSVKIELHERICEKLPWRITDASQFIYPSEPHPGLNAYPTKASLMIHLLLHAAGSMTIRALRLLHLHDLATLSLQMSEEDWNQVLALSSYGHRLWWAFPPLRLVSRYYPEAIPPHVLTVLGAQCPHLLKAVATRRSLYDVSYSYPWVNAFPGIEWSQSIGEMLEYAASRLRPDAGHVALRAHHVKNQAWAANSSWDRSSQTRRMLRWVTSRPTRAPTMHAIQAALAQPA
jgi:hypothetical protein